MSPWRLWSTMHSAEMSWARSRSVHTHSLGEVYRLRLPYRLIEVGVVGVRCQCTANWYGQRCTEAHDDCSSASSIELCVHGTCHNVPRNQPDQVGPQPPRQPAKLTPSYVPQQTWPPTGLLLLTSTKWRRNDVTRRPACLRPCSLGKIC